ncbi:hypothetical protein J3F83DRAFT_543728 [Trichoderma novae-zelandiae]
MPAPNPLLLLPRPLRASLLATIFACTVAFDHLQCRVVDDLPNVILARSATQPHLLPNGPLHVWISFAAWKRDRSRGTIPPRKEKDQREGEEEEILVTVDRHLILASRVFSSLSPALSALVLAAYSPCRSNFDWACACY